MRIIKQDLRVYIFYDKDWYIVWHKSNGRHREDGPAIIWNGGQEYYYLKGERYSKDKDSIKSYWKEIHANY